MKKPWYQKAITVYIPWIVTGFVFIGSLLDTIVNSIELITPQITIYGTALVVLVFAAAKTILPRRPFEWLTEDGQTVRLKSIGIGPTLALVGIFIALWIPRISNTLRGDSALPSDDGVHVITPDLIYQNSDMNEPSAIVDFFPIFLGYSWTYNFVVASELQADEFSVNQFTRKVVSVETGLGDRIRIVEIHESGGPTYLSNCLRDTSRYWYVLDETRLFDACSKNEAYEIAMDLKNEGQWGTSERLMTPDYVAPFEVGNLWAWDISLPPREDTNYQWHVDAKVDVTVPAGTFKDCYRILLYMLNSSTIRWICPGVGLVAAEYHHHGAQDDFRAELASFGFAHEGNTPSE